ncbi:hypothetical protein Tco_1280626 [Tanacetum coccineum]
MREDEVDELFLFMRVSARDKMEQVSSKFGNGTLLRMTCATCSYLSLRLSIAYVTKSSLVMLDPRLSKREARELIFRNYASTVRSPISKLRNSPTCSTVFERLLSLKFFSKASQMSLAVPFIRRRCGGSRRCTSLLEDRGVATSYMNLEEGAPIRIVQFVGIKGDNHKVFEVVDREDLCVFGWSRCFVNHVEY